MQHADAAAQRHDTAEQRRRHQGDGTVAGRRRFAAALTEGGTSDKSAVVSASTAPSLAAGAGAASSVGASAATGRFTASGGVLAVEGSGMATSGVGASAAGSSAGVSAFTLASMIGPPALPRACWRSTACCRCRKSWLSIPPSVIAIGHARQHAVKQRVARWPIGHQQSGDNRAPARGGGSR